MSRDALVVGINRYRAEGLADLSSPAADAEAIAQMLEKYGGFKVRRIPEAIDPNTGLPYVGKTTEAALMQLEEALVQLFTPESHQVPDTALFYFSGHGIRKQRGVSEGFLAASDVYPQMGFCGLPLQWLRKLLEASSVRQQVVWLDCCHSGAWLGAGEADPGERGRGRDRAFIAAARDFEGAEQEITSPYSVMTRALLAGLEPQPDRPVTNITLVDFLNRELQNATQRPIYTNFGEPIELIRPLTTPEKTAAPTEVAATDICPYKGLAYFECNDEDPKYFYGRTALTDELLDGVRRGNFLAVLGASGSGKSSVLRAGLMHQLKRGRQVSGSETWQVRVFVPGSHPLQSLAAAFLDGDVSDLERSQQLAIAEQRIAEGAAGLRRLVQSATASRVVLVIDQFEEVFTLCGDRAERERFFQCLLGAIPSSTVEEGEAFGLERVDFSEMLSPKCFAPTVSPSSKLCIVLAMRADFFSKCLEREYSGLADRIRQHLVAVTPMTREELEGAIVRPAKDVGLAIEPELVRQMLADVVGAPGHLPLLQYALRELWQLRSRSPLAPEKRSPLTPLEKGGTDSSPLARGIEGDLLTLKTYTQLGGVMGTLNDRAAEWEERGKGKDDLLQGRRLREVRELRQEVALSKLAEGFIDGSVRQRWIDLLKFVGNVVVIPLIGTIVAGVSISREIELYEYRQTIDDCRGLEKKCPGRITALEKLHQANREISNFNLENAYLEKIQLPEALLMDANLAKATLGGVNLMGANLARANLAWANLAWANLEKANLAKATLGGANLRKVTLGGANLRGSDFTKKVKNLTPEQVKSACYWQEAKFEPEFQAKLDRSPDLEREVDCSQWER